MISTTTTTTVTTPSAGSNVAVPFPQRFDEEEHLVLYRVTSAGARTTLTEGVHYSVAGTGNEAGGTITVFTVNAGDTIIASREVDITQQQDYVTNDRFPAAGTEGQLDKQIMIDQQLNNGLGRAIKVLPGEPNPVVSARADRQETIPSWDPNGDYIEYTLTELWNLLPVPPGTVSNQGTINFINQAARDAKTPDAAGQIGVQLDTNKLYIAESTVTGDWRPYHPEGIGIETEEQFIAAITAGSPALFIDASFVLTSRQYIPEISAASGEPIKLIFSPQGAIDFNDTVNLLELDCAIVASPQQQIFKNTAAGSASNGALASVYGTFGYGTRYVGWWLGVSGQAYGTYTNDANPGNYKEAWFQAAVDSGYVLIKGAAGQPGRPIILMRGGGAYKFNKLQLNLSDRRICLAGVNMPHFGALEIKVNATYQDDTPMAGSRLKGSFVITLSGKDGSGFYVGLYSVSVSFDPTYLVRGGLNSEKNLGLIRLNSPNTLGNRGLQEFSRMQNVQLSYFTTYGAASDMTKGSAGAFMNGFQWEGGNITNMLRESAVAIFLPDTSSSVEPQHTIFRNFTINGGAGSGRAIVWQKGAQATFQNFHIEDCSIAFWITGNGQGNPRSGQILIDSLNMFYGGGLQSDIFRQKLSQQFVDGDTITIGRAVGDATTYRFKTTPTQANDIQISSTNPRLTIDNLIAAINQTGTVANYYAGTTAPLYPSWLTATEYLVDALVHDPATGKNYQCKVKHTSGTFATDNTSGYWINQSSEYSAWLTATTYNAGDLVTNGSGYYQCTSATSHSSGTFNTDFDNGEWEFVEPLMFPKAKRGRAREFWVAMEAGGSLYTASTGDGVWGGAGDSSKTMGCALYIDTSDQAVQYGFGHVGLRNLVYRFETSLGGPLIYDSEHGFIRRESTDSGIQSYRRGTNACELMDAFGQDYALRSGQYTSFDYPIPGGDLVTSAGLAYRAITDHTAGANFAADAANWIAIDSPVKIWATALVYNVGDYRRHHTTNYTFQDADITAGVISIGLHVFESDTTEDAKVYITSTGNVPSELTANNTPYWVYYVSNTEIQLRDAKGGTPLAVLTGVDGAATHTIRPATWKCIAEHSSNGDNHMDDPTQTKWVDVQWQNEGFVDGNVTIDPTNTITITGHLLTSEDKVYLTTSGTLPTGLALSTLYYVLKVDANTIQLARTKGGAPVVISAAAAGGNHLVKPVYWNGQYNNVSLPAMGIQKQYIINPSSQQVWSGLERMDNTSTRFKLINASPYQITLLDNDGGSSSGYRFRLPGATSYFWSGYSSIELIYSPSATEWLLIGSSSTSHGVASFGELSSAPEIENRTGKLFCVNNGGKTELKVIFATGAAQQIAIEV